MCGIAGYVGLSEPGLIEGMCRILRHRGPDGEGIIDLPEVGIALGMRRLAVIDLEGGNQPMSAENGRVHLVCNGEIYNYQDLRRELRDVGHGFETASDTEVVLKAYLAWGEAAWSRLHGMFAIAIADLRNGRSVLRLVRDRVGIKPLYYIERGGALLFASELKALTLWSGFERRIDLAAVSSYLALRYVPGPGCLFAEVKKFPAGHEMVFENGRGRLVRWWSSPDPDRQRAAQSDEETVQDVGDALRQAVRRHMVSDVPIGAFLSGGIDSNVIVALMAEAGSAPIKTFSIGFPDHPDDDTRRARATAEAIGADHTELECRPSDFARLTDIAWSLDEPIGDPIIVPMSVLASEARKEVTVVLSGEGADEILGGYLFHRKILELTRWRARTPRPLWPLAAGLVSRMPTTLLDRAFDYPGRLGKAGRQKVANLIRATGDGGLETLYRSSVSLFDPDDVAIASAGRLSMPEIVASASSSGTPLQQLLALQYADWLPDDILMKTDKITMAQSLEARVPFMDTLVIDAAARAPDRTKLKHKTNKWALRRFARDLLPETVTTAPKRAFYAPIESHLRNGALADLIRAMLDPERLSRRGLIDPAYVGHLAASGEDEGFLPGKRLFALLMLELWLERFCT